MHLSACRDYDHRGATSEQDNDGDCYVECTGFDPATWKVQVFPANIDNTGVVVTETAVIEQDAMIPADVYPGCWLESTTRCLRDADETGILIPLGRPVLPCNGL